MPTPTEKSRAGSGFRGADVDKIENFGQGTRSTSRTRTLGCSWLRARSCRCAGLVTSSSLTCGCEDQAWVLPGRAELPLGRASSSGRGRKPVRPRENVTVGHALPKVRKPTAWWEKLGTVEEMMGERDDAKSGERVWYKPGPLSCQSKADD